jgi:hypothetical protein
MYVILYGMEIAMTFAFVGSWMDYYPHVCRLWQAAAPVCLNCLPDFSGWSLLLLLSSPHILCWHRLVIV